MNKAENNIRKTSFKKAGQALIDHIQETEKVDLQRIEQSLEDLKNSYQIQHKRRKLWLYAASAAASLLIAALSINFLYSPNSYDWDMLATSLLNDSIPHQDKEITLITQNDRMKLSNEASLEYKKNGTLQVNKEDVTKESPVTKKSSTTLSSRKEKGPP